MSERLRRHKARHKGYTGANDDWIVVHTEVFPDNIMAAARERESKNKKSRKYIEQLIKGSEHPPS